MNLFLQLLGLGIIYILGLIYVSFMFSQEITCFTLHITNQELLIALWVLLVLFSVVLFFKNKTIFIPLHEMKLFLVLHLLFSLSLIYIGEYFFCVVLQFLFVAMLYKHYNITLYFYLQALFISLLLLFSGNYFIYFVDMLVIIYVILKKELFFRSKEVKSFFVSAAGVLITYFIFNTLWFNIYIWSDIVDQVNYVDAEVSLPLSVLQVFTLYFIIKKYKNINLFKNK